MATTTSNTSRSKAAAPKSSQKQTSKKSSVKSDASMVTLSSVYAGVAAKRSIDTTRAAKLVRSRLRSNFAKVCELSPNVKQAKQSANDGNRWPTHVTKELRDFVLA